MKSQGGTRLAGKIALVTGASRGIGFAIANTFLCEGASVVITGRDRGRLDTAVEALSIHGDVQGILCDVRQEASVENLFIELKRSYSRLDVLINNAGIAGRACKIEQISSAEWRDAIDTNLTGTFLVTRSALPLLTNGATIVNNISMAAKVVFPGMAAYGASKFGALGFTESLREELRPRGIRVLALMPGAVDTDIWQQFWPDAPRSRMMTPDSIAHAVLTAVLMPENTTIQDLVISPTYGKL